MKRKTCKTILTLLALVGGTQWAAAQGTAFTFQGLLTGQVVPSEGTCDLRFALFDAASGGGAVGSPLTNAAVGVTNGLFTTMLDFGAGAFTGPARWLEIAVRTNGAAAFAVLAPRQPLTPAPYAIFAGGVNAAGIVGTISATNIGAGTITSASLDPNVGVWSRSGANVFYIGGNVGIGMSAPTNALQVVGNVTVEGAETIELRANHVTLGQTNVANGSGATAMGITTRASGGGATAMGGLTTASGVYSTAMGLLTAASGSGSTAMGISSRASGLGSLAAGDQANAIHDGSFVWADLQNTEFASTSTNQFLIRAAGGVGINTTTPATALHVNGAATVSGVGSFVARTAAALVLSNTTANTGRTWEWHALDDGRLQLVDVKAGSSGTRMMVAANGYVGIGTTTPSERLHVVGNIAAVGDIHATGNVGINTTNPATALHVNGNTVLEGGFTPSSATASNLLNLAVGLNANGALNGISFYESSGAAAMSLGYDGLVHNALRIYDNAGGAPVSFLQGGNVGIGTIDPVAHFTVAGSG
ncbi:MAG: hypothetical protein NT154_25080, partial [Verrucomicrobia bacterium]|nr:hypothetical protein [Verrucomicrobiota bacterium]